MRCRECESLLWTYIDDELPEAQRRAVASHLAGCPRCGHTYDEIRGFPLRTGQIQIVPPPPDFTSRLMQRISPLPSPQELAAQQERTRSNGWHGPVGMLVAFSTAAAAIFLGLLSTSALALAGGRPLPHVETGSAASGIANAIGFGVVLAFWRHLSWPIVAALVGMLAALALLWIRIATPHRWDDGAYGPFAPRRQRR
jgi:anti-sigma factor RsiW